MGVIKLLSRGLSMGWWRRQGGLGLFCHVESFFFFGESFDGVAEHGAGDGFEVFFEEAFYWGLVYFGGFAEHPAGGFVDEVLSVVY